jgi:7-cyano-7-deazaguanine synthase
MSVVCLVSGGLDSAVLVKLCRHRFSKLYALTVDYGQTHKREVEAARQISEIADEWRLVKLELPVKSQLVGGQIPDASAGWKPTWVPARNAVLLSVAAGYAEAVSADTIGIAVHLRDANYPDCTVEFIQAMEKTLSIALSRRIQIYAPFVNMSKADVVRVGAELFVPFEKTWSCYRGEQIHCGTCKSCVERKQAFREANVPDPTVYAKGGVRS